MKVGTAGFDKGYDSGPFMIELEQRGVTPHVAMNLTGPGKQTVGGTGRRN